MYRNIVRCLHSNQRRLVQGKINIGMIKSLRKRTAASISACKKALEEADGNEELAMKILKQQSASMLSGKFSERAAEEGVVAVVVDQQRRKASMCQVKCETDFCARTERFLEGALRVLDTGIAAKEIEKELAMALGERIVVDTPVSIEVNDFEFLGIYAHGGTMSGCGHKAVIARLQADVPCTEDHVQALHSIANSVAQQALAMHPLPLGGQDVVVPLQGITEGKLGTVLEDLGAKVGLHGWKAVDYVYCEVGQPIQHVK